MRERVSDAEKDCWKFNLKLITMEAKHETVGECGGVKSWKRLSKIHTQNQPKHKYIQFYFII